MASLVLLDATPLSGPDNERGTQTYVRGVIGAMRRLPVVERPDLIVAPDVPGRDDFVIRRLPRRHGRADWVRTRRSTDAIAAQTEVADLVHLTSPDTAIAAPVQISSCHDLIPLRFPAIELGAGRSRARRRYNRFLDRLLWARLVLVPSQATANDLTELLAIPAHRIRVIPYGAPERAIARRAVAGTDQEPYLLVVGNREPHTNAALAVRALARTNPRHGLRLVIAGVDDRRRRDRLERLATALGVDARTQIHGVLAPAQLSELRTGAVGAVVPSRIDGFSVPALAGMAHGIPIVASDIPALGEVLGPAGLVVPGFNPDVWAEAFDGLAEDAHLREQLAQGSRSRAARLSWTHTAVRTCACYAEVRDE